MLFEQVRNIESNKKSFLKFIKKDSIFLLKKV
jgi:hypothetical protein